MLKSWSTKGICQDEENTEGTPAERGFISSWSKLHLTATHFIIWLGDFWNQRKQGKTPGGRHTYENNFSLPSDLFPLFETSKRAEQAGDIPGWMAAIREWHYKNTTPSSSDLPESINWIQLSDR